MQRLSERATGLMSDTCMIEMATPCSRSRWPSVLLLQRPGYCCINLSTGGIPRVS